MEKKGSSYRVRYKKVQGCCFALTFDNQVSFALDYKSKRN